MPEAGFVSFATLWLVLAFLEEPDIIGAKNSWSLDEEWVVPALFYWKHAITEKGA